MFRKMLRSGQALSGEECVEILKNEVRGVLSVLGDDDYPYALPINFWYCEDNGRLYFHCGKKGHKIDAVKQHDKVSFCVYDGGENRDGDWSKYFRSVIIFGRIAAVEDKEKALNIIRRLSYKFTSDSEYIENEITHFAAGVLCLELIPEHMTGKLVHEA